MSCDVCSTAPQAEASLDAAIDYEYEHDYEYDPPLSLAARPLCALGVLRGPFPGDIFTSGKHEAKGNVVYYLQDLLNHFSCNPSGTTMLHTCLRRICIYSEFTILASWATLFLTDAPLRADDEQPEFQVPAAWEYSAPLIAPEQREKDPSRAQKDPTLVFYEGRWHVFMTVKLPGRSAIEYCSFKDWKDANASQRTILQISDSNYYCAPQVFYFTPHKKWYLIYQMGVEGANKMWVAYSTTSTISDPNSWTRARPILDGGPDDPRTVGGLDYWIICDDKEAHLFLTSLNGKMWRLHTDITDFPHGFHDCRLALQAKIFEASHTYRLKGRDQYLTIVEENGRRYYKAYVADSLAGPWRPVADTAEHPFAGWANIRPAAGVEPWTDNVSHGELVRDGVDQTLTVDPDNLRFVFQGMLDKHKAGKGYGQFQWRIGMLTPVRD